MTQATEAIVAEVSRLAASLSGRARSDAGADADTPLANGGFWLDSIALLELVVACEQTFGVSLEEIELTPDDLSTVGRLAGLIAGRMAAHPSVRSGGS